MRATLYNSVLPNFTGFFFQVEVGFMWYLLGFTYLNWVLPIFFTGFYLVLLGFTGFYLVLPSFTGFYWELLVFTEFYLVLLVFT